MTVPFVDLPALVRPHREEYLAAFARILDTGAFVGGPAVAEFERDFAAFIGTTNAIAVRTGTDALVLALRALGIGPGDEVITATNSFFATAEAISLVGATPVFADVCDDTLLIDPEDIQRRITERTRCLIPVHLFGQVADMDAILDIARKHGLRVLEDSAQAHGATRRTRDGRELRAGAIGDVAAFSFYPTKNLGALGEGGAVTTNDAALAARVEQLRDHGQTQRHNHAFIGYNARLDALQCAWLSVSLRSLEANNDKRRALAAHYRQQLADIQGVRLVAEAADSHAVYHLFVVRVREAIRDAVRERLSTSGIATAIHYPTPIHLQPPFIASSGGARTRPIAERAAHEMLSLPMFPTMSVQVAEMVCAALRSELS
jgi:dTDP-4-amino-4,6-dideoxygalactose transaminase